MQLEVHPLPQFQLNTQTKLPVSVPQSPRKQLNSKELYGRSLAPVNHKQQKHLITVAPRSKGEVEGPVGLCFREDGGGRGRGEWL